MGVLGERVVVNSQCTITALKSGKVHMLKGRILSVNDTLTSVILNDPDKAECLANADRIILNAADKEGREFSASDERLLFSKKNPGVVALSTLLHTAYSNNREFPRFLYKVPIAWRLSQLDMWHVGSCHDVSRNGIGMEIDTTLPVGSTVELDLYDNIIDSHIYMKATVMHSSLRGSECYLVGCQVNDSQLADLVDKLADKEISAS